MTLQATPRVDPVERTPVDETTDPRARSWTWWLLVLAVTAVTVAVRWHGLAGGPAYRDDEGTYVAQAWAVVHRGTLAHYTYWYDHPPLGWLVIALWRWATGPFLHAPTEVLAGRQLMVVLAAVSVVLVMVVGRRLGLRWWAGGTAGLLWALSPLAVGFSASVWLDNPATTFALGALACALSPRRHLWAFAGAGALLGCAVLSKETALLLAPALLVAVWRTSAGRTRPFCVAAFATCALLVLLAFPLLALLKGELLPGPGHVSLVEAVGWQLHGRAGTGSPLVPSSGSAGLVGLWLAQDPWLLGSGVLAAPVAVLDPRLRAPAVGVLVPVVVALRPGYLPEPYVVMLLPLCALLAAGVLDRLVPRGRAPVIGPALASCVLALLLLVSWLPGLRQVHSARATSQVLAVEDWVTAHVPHDERVVVDDSMWVDLVRRGFDPDEGVIWFYKTDVAGGLDESVRRALPGGFRDIQWLVLSPIMRDALAVTPTGFTDLRQAVSRATVVHTIGTGGDSYQVLQLARQSDR